MKTSRQKLLEYIRQHHIVTAIEISRAMQMTGANVRHHLSILEQQGVVCVIGQKMDQVRGRPALVYGLTELVKEQNLARLASALWEVFVQPLTPEAQGDIMRRLALCLVTDVENRIKKTSAVNAAHTLTQRFYLAVMVLNNLCYQARWEAHRQSPRLILGHCPYTNILDDHPGLCTMDAYLIGILLEKPVRQVARLALDRNGLSYCLFTPGE